MGELAARTIFSNDTGPLAGVGLDTLAKNQAAILELEGAQAPQSKTITDGSISPTAAYVIVDTEGSAAADDLIVINPVLSASENLHDGMIVHLKAADRGRVVTVKNSSSANGINTYNGSNYILSTTHWLKLQLRSGKWYEVEGRAMETALAASTPATTTARGIGRVATLADIKPGATVENGPAFPDVNGGVITTTPKAHAVPQADANGKLDGGWLSLDLPGYLQPSMTGSATLNGTTNNTVQLTDIVTTLGLEVGDVIRIQYSGYDKLHSVESITNNRLIVVNYEHAGNCGNGSLKLANTTASVTITRIAKWYNAPIGLGQAWVNVMNRRSKDITYDNTTGRPFEVSVSYQITGDNAASHTFNVSGVKVGRSDTRYGSSEKDSFTNSSVPAGASYSVTNAEGTLFIWAELR